jgi:hypothetical protein
LFVNWMNRIGFSVPTAITPLNTSM